jgi:uncharacterized protein
VKYYSEYYKDKNMSDYLAELKHILADLNPYKAILFGSYADGKADADSDIDLIVVLDKNEKTRNFDERAANYSLVKDCFISLKNKVPMDIIVYTRPEWYDFVNADNSFTREILEKGKSVI